MPKNRNSLLDTWRTIAAVSIIWLHTVTVYPLTKTAQLGRFAVPFFAAASVYYASRNTKISFSQHFLRRFKKIYIPFIFWSIIYYVFRYIGARITSSPNPVYGFNVFIIGTTHHLWFLPFILFVSVFSQLISLNIKNNNILFHQKRNISYFLLFCLIIWLVLTPSLEEYGYFISLSGNAIGGSIFGLIIAISDIKISNLYAAILFLIALAILILIVVTGRDIALENIAGMCIFMASLNFSSDIQNRISSRALSLLSKLGHASFSAYLIHVLFVEGFQDLANLLSFSDSLKLDLLIFLSSTILSFSLPIAFENIRYRINPVMSVK